MYDEGGRVEESNTGQEVSRANIYMYTVYIYMELP